MTTTTHQAPGRRYVLLDEVLGVAAVDHALHPDSRQLDFFDGIRAGVREAVARRLAALGMSEPGLQTPSKNYPSKEKMVAQGAFMEPDGTVLPLAFVARYGIDRYSLGALNYRSAGEVKIPSLRAFANRPTLSLGSLAVPLANRTHDLGVVADDGAHLTAYSVNAGPKRRKSYVALYDVRFAGSVFASHVKTRAAACTAHRFDEIRIALNSYPMLFACRTCGQLATCTCFAGHYDPAEIFRELAGGADWRPFALPIDHVAGLCHLCTGGTPRCEYGSSMYYSTLMQRFRPYHELWVRKGVAAELGTGQAREVENRLREHLGFPRIGERFLTEMHVLRIVRVLFPSHEIVHHYPGDELEGLEIDIWVPEIRLGVEYQGEQHYRPIAAWGGEAALAALRARDAKKRKLCRRLGYHLVEVRHSDDLSPEAIAKAVRRVLDQADA